MLSSNLLCDSWLNCYLLVSKGEQQIGYLQQPDGQIVMVNLGGAMKTSQTGGKLINLNESAFIQTQALY